MSKCTQLERQQESVFRTRWGVVCCMVAVMACPCSTGAQGARVAEQPPPPTILRVGIYENPPYTMRNDDGDWEGLAVDLWQEAASKLLLAHRFVEMPFEDLVPSLHDAQVDVVISELPIIPENAELIDFSLPYLTSSLGVAVAVSSRPLAWLGVLGDFFTWEFVALLGLILGGLVVSSVLVWAMEHGHRESQFSEKGLRGLGSAIWFSAVTMTTVGYGDKTPRSFAGRVVAFCWMLCGVVILALFTGGVASSVTTRHFEGRVDSFHDLLRVPTGVTADADSELFLRRLGVVPRVFPGLDGGLHALTTGELAAFVADRHTLSYLLTRHPTPRVRLSPLQIGHFHIAFGLKPESALRQPLNVAILEVLSTDLWRGRMRHWLGEDVFYSGAQPED